MREAGQTKQTVLSEGNVPFTNRGKKCILEKDTFLSTIENVLFGEKIGLKLLGQNVTMS